MSKLREWRKAKKWTQGELADKVGTAVSTICRIETGNQWPDPGTLLSIEKVTKGAVTASDIAAEHVAAG